MALTSVTDLAAEVNFVAQSNFLRNARFWCPYFEGTMPGMIEKHSLTFSVTWRRIDNLTPNITAISENTTYQFGAGRTPTTMADSNVTAAILKYGDFVVISEEVDLISKAALWTDKTIEVLSIQAGRSLNRLQRNIVEDNATLVRPGGATTDGGVASAISGTLIASVVNTLDRNGAIRFRPNRTIGSTNIGTTPIREAHLGICHSDVEWDIRALASFIAAERYAGQTDLYGGEFGMAEGVRWVSTPEASVDGGGAASGDNFRETVTAGQSDLYTCPVYGMDALGSVSLDTNLIKSGYMSGDKIPGIELIVKPFGSSGVADPFNEQASAAWKARHAGAVLNGDWVRGIRVASRVLQ